MSDTEAAAAAAAPVTGNASPTSEANSSEPSSAHASPAKAKDKIDVLLKATGNAPIMKKRKWGVERVKKIGAINEFVRKYIKSEPHESLFLYVNQAFAPSPDIDIGTLYDCFGSDGKLVLHYALTEAWG